jgi:outer membrane protein assembly factor BamC
MRRRTFYFLSRMKFSASVVIAAALLVSGCSAVSDLLETRKVDYKSAGKLPPLEVPPDLTRPAQDDRFVVPDARPSGSATFSAYAKDRSGQPAAGNSDLLPKVDNVRIERAGTQRWLVVQATPDDLWPAVKAFWQETGFLINVEVREAGVMETDWAEKRAKVDDGIIRNFLSKALGSTSTNGERDKFRTRLEAGSTPKTTEIFISHRGLVEIAESRSSDARIIWQPRPADPELEAEMMRRLMVRLGVQEARAKAGLEQASSATPRARITRSKDGEGRLAIDDQFDRAWRRVGLALDRVGFTVEDRDRSKGLYFVRYVDPEADANSKKPTGMLSRLAFWRSDSDPKDRKAQYRIVVKDVDPGSEINVLTKEGQLDRTETAHRILSLLFEQLK